MLPVMQSITRITNADNIARNCVLSIHFFQNSLLLGDIKLASAKTVSRRAIKFTDGGSFSSGFYFQNKIFKMIIPIFITQ